MLRSAAPGGGAAAVLTWLAGSLGGDVGCPVLIELKSERLMARLSTAQRVCIRIGDAGAAETQEQWHEQNFAWDQEDGQNGEYF